jgi:hypothetical protein
VWVRVPPPLLRESPAKERFFYGRQKVPDFEAGDFGSNAAAIDYDRASSIAAAAGDPTNTSVVAGSGSPQMLPSAVSNTVFDCAGTEGVLVTYDVTIPVGQTRSVLLFNQLNSTPTAATEDVGVFNDNTALAATDFLAGLSAADLATVVNFDFDSTAPKVISTFPRNGGKLAPLPTSGLPSQRRCRRLAS